MTETVVVRLEKDIVDQLWLLAASKIKIKKTRVSLSEVVRDLLPSS